MNKLAGNNLQYSKLVLEELEERRLFSGGIEGLIVTSLDSDAQAIYRDLDTKEAQQSTTDGDASVAAAEQQSQEIVFVDAGVDNYQQLVDDIYASSDAGRNIEVVILDRDRDGIEQISTLLQERDDLDAIHIISHGSDGSVQLGSSNLDADSLTENNDSIALWANAFAESGDILIYGCNLAQSQVGKSLINDLGELTLTDVAASDDLTGHASQDGDWELEVSVGSIETSAALSAGVQQQWSALLAAPSATADPGAYSTDLLALNPLSYWQLGEAGGAAADLGSSANAGTYNGAPLLGQTGAINGDSDTAVHFDGIDDYVELAHTGDYLLDDGTIQLWFNVDTAATGNPQYLFSKDSNGFDTGGHVSIYLDATGNLEVRLQSTTNHYFITSATAVTGGDWHHVAFSFGTDGMELYLDGAIAGTDIYTGGLGTTSGGIGNLEPIAIGGATINSDDLLVTPVNNFFTGSIDEVAIVGSQLDAATIKGLYAAGQQDYTTSEDVSFNVIASEGVLINDYDPEGDALSVVAVNGSAPGVGTAVTLASGAQVTLNADGSFSYDPNGQFEYLDVGESTTDSFNYTVSDGNGGSDTTTVTITINGVEDGSVIGGTAVGTVTEDGPLIATDTLTITDVDISDNPIRFNNQAPTPGDNGYGNFEISGNIWAFTLNNALASVQALDVGDTLSDTFTFTAYDGSTQVVTVTINGAEDAALIGGTSAGAVTEDLAVVAGNINTSGILTVVDPDVGESSFQAGVSNGSYGDLTIDAAGNWSYVADNSQAAIQTLAAGESLVDTLTVTSFDGTTANVVITINGAEDAPTLDNAIANQTATEDIAFSFTFAANTFGDIDTTDTLTYTATLSDNSALPGWLNFNGPSRTFSGIPANPDVGAIDIRITADDGIITVTDTFTLTVINADDAPVIGGTSAGAVTEDLAVVAGNISTSGILTVADPDVGESSFQAGVSNGSYGNLTIDTLGNWSYAADNSQAAIQTLAVGESLVDTLTVTSFDGTTANVVITINGAEDAAVVGGTATAVVAEDGTLVATNSLTISDTDTSDNPVGFNDVAPTPGGNGYGSFEMTANTWTYTLNNGLDAVQSLGAGETLSDTFTFTATDGSTQLVTVTINGVAEPQAAPPPAPPPVVDPPVFDPSPEFDPSPDDLPPDREGAAVSGFGLEPPGIEIVRVPQDPTSSPVREEIDVAAYLQQDEAETTTAESNPSNSEQVEKIMGQPLQQAMQQRNLQLDQLTLQVSDDAQLTARYEQELLDRIDRMQQGIESDSGRQNADEIEVQIIMGTTVSLTAGIVSWVLRGGSLLASLMSTVPLLNRFDPLPILKSRDEKEDVEEDKDNEITDTTIRRREKRVDGMFSGTDSAHE